MVRVEWNSGSFLYISKIMWKIGGASGGRESEIRGGKIKIR